MTVRLGAAGTTIDSTMRVDSDGTLLIFVEFDGAGNFSVEVDAINLAQAIFSGVSDFSIDAVVNTPPATLDYLRPDADDADGGWTNELDGTDLFPSIDESSPDDDDYIKSSPNPSSDICRFRLSNPLSGVEAPAKIRVRYKRTGAGPVDLTVRLKQGASEIASWAYPGISDEFVTATETLTTPQFEAITDFGDLFLELEADS